MKFSQFKIVNTASHVLKPSIKKDEILEFSRMIIRVQSPDGMSRVNLDNSAAFSDLYAKTKENITSNRSYTLYKDRERKRPVKSSRSRVDLKHGDILYLFFDSGKFLNSVKKFSIEN